MYEIRPSALRKLDNRLFDKSVLKAVFDHESEHKSVVKLPDHPSTWGWVSRGEIASRMGFSHMSKSLSRKIRRSFVWLAIHGYLKYFDVNAVGKKFGATRFLIVFWVFRFIAKASKGFSRTKTSKATSRTPEIFEGVKPCREKTIKDLFLEMTQNKKLATC